MTDKHICDCGRTYYDYAGLDICQATNHGATTPDEQKIYTILLGAYVSINNCKAQLQEAFAEIRKEVPTDD